jgi:hypothetical protein
VGNVNQPRRASAVDQPAFLGPDLFRPAGTRDTAWNDVDAARQSRRGGLESVPHVLRLNDDGSASQRPAQNQCPEELEPGFAEFQAVPHGARTECETLMNVHHLRRRAPRRGNIAEGKEHIGAGARQPSRQPAIQPPEPAESRVPDGNRLDLDAIPGRRIIKFPAALRQQTHHPLPLRPRVRQPFQKVEQEPRPAPHPDADGVNGYEH